MPSPSSARSWGLGIALGRGQYAAVFGAMLYWPLTGCMLCSAWPECQLSGIPLHMMSPSAQGPAPHGPTQTCGQRCRGASAMWGRRALAECVALRFGVSRVVHMCKPASLSNCAYHDFQLCRIAPVISRRGAVQRTIRARTMIPFLCEATLGGRLCFPLAPCILSLRVFPPIHTPHSAPTPGVATIADRLVGGRSLRHILRVG